MTSWGGGTGAACARAAYIGAATLLLGAASPSVPSAPSVPPPLTTDVPFDLLGPDLWRSVTLKWNAGSGPLCAATRSRRDWEALTRTVAAPKGKDSGTAPPTPDEWNRHAVLLLGRQIGSTRVPLVFHVDGVHRQGSTIELDYSLTPTPPTGGTTWFAAVAIMKPLTPTVTFKEGGRVVCTVQPMAGRWVSPSQPAPAPAPQSDDVLSGAPAPAQ